ncbi:hypothetical protein K4L44_08510 [Halosquirtibacter laminarini]|uniref:Uncharacterized protein n=1 Tax=Halosquirtibacter laminarini TaxID=3374600 RepID=A0AC61NJD5_9BACT|nr:hypothetical protein K4L44_08510 [Prolixibacteraceae bacterium]
MKKLVFIIALMFTSVLTIQAQITSQDLGTAKERAEKQTDLMKEKLELTKEQEGKVYQINLETAEKLDKVMQLSSRMEKINAFRVAQLEKNEALEEILTKEQYKKYKDLQDEMRKKAKENWKTKKG